MTSIEVYRLCCDGRRNVLKFRLIFAFPGLDDSVLIKREATMTPASVFLKETCLRF